MIHDHWSLVPLAVELESLYLAHGDMSPCGQLAVGEVAVRANARVGVDVYEVTVVSLASVRSNHSRRHSCRRFRSATSVGSGSLAYLAPGNNLEASICEVARRRFCTMSWRVSNTLGARGRHCCGLSRYWMVFPCWGGQPLVFLYQAMPSLRFGAKLWSRAYLT